MIALRDYAGRRVLVLTLNEEGVAAARALKAGGARVEAFDGDTARCAVARGYGLDIVDPTTRDWADLALLVVGDVSMVAEDAVPRLVTMARSLDIPTLSATQLIAEAIAAQPGGHTVSLKGRFSYAAACLTRHILKACGRAVAGPSLTDAPIKPVAGLIGLITRDYERGVPGSSVWLCGSDPRPEQGFQTAQDAAFCLCSSDDPAPRRLAMMAGRSSWLFSGRMTLASGFFVAGGSLFDGNEGSVRPVSALAELEGLKFTPPAAIAAGYGLARLLGVSFDEARAALRSFKGAPGEGGLLGRLGGLRLVDVTGVEDAAALCDMIRPGGPVVWIGGPSVDPACVEALAQQTKHPVAILLAGDRRKVRRKLARLCPVRVETDPLALLARAIFAAAKAGPGSRIVCAPGSAGHPDFGDTLRATLDTLLQTLGRKDAA